ncbi:g1 s-specific cyclin [Moniliophthora roreri]|nr:g1 s-specific cyclin [Moniliophthora roreri]
MVAQHGGGQWESRVRVSLPPSYLGFSSHQCAYTFFSSIIPQNLDSGVGLESGIFFEATIYAGTLCAGRPSGCSIRLEMSSI